MRIPFSLDLSVGTDLVACKRILDYSSPNKDRLLRLTSRVLHPGELRDLETRFSWWRQLLTHPESERHRLSQWLAGRWAAKEAAKKAWGASVLSWKDLRVENSATGSPRIVCAPAAIARGTVKAIEQEANLSISHDGDYAVATVLATPLHSDILAELQRRRTEAEIKVARRATS